MSSQLSPFVVTALDRNGKPISGAKLYMYEAGTTTLATVYTDIGLTTEHAQPIIADSSGNFPSIYQSAGNYKYKLTTANDVDVYTRDNIPSTISNTSGALPISTGGTGATSASAARTALGAASASDVSNINTTVSGITGQITNAGGTLRAMAGKENVTIDDFGVDLTGILQIASFVFPNAGMSDTQGAEVATRTITPKRADSSFLILAGGVAVTSSDVVATQLGLFRSGSSASLNTHVNQPNGRAAELLVSVVPSGGTSEFTLSLRSTATSFTYENPYIIAIEFIATPVS